MTLTIKQAAIYGGCLALIGILVGSYVGCSLRAAPALVPEHHPIPVMLPAPDTQFVQGPIRYLSTSAPHYSQQSGEVENRVDTFIITKFVSEPCPDSITKPVPKSLTDLFSGVHIPDNTLPAFTKSENPQAYVGVKLQHDFLGGAWSGGLDLRAHIVSKFYVIADAGLFAKQFQANAGVEYRFLEIY